MPRLTIIKYRHSSKPWPLIYSIITSIRFTPYLQIKGNLIQMKNILLVGLAFILAKSSDAQVQAGLKAGLNLANIYIEGDEDSRARTAFHAGGLLNIALPNKLFLQPELLYSVKGKRTLATAFNNEARLSLNYIAVPLLVGYRYNNNFSVALGPEFGFLTSVNSKFNGINNDVSAFYRKFDVGIELSLAYSFTKALGLDLRYNYGFKNLINGVFTDAYGNVVGQGRIGANRVLQVGVYSFPGRKNR